MEAAVRRLLNVVEAVSVDKQSVFYSAAARQIFRGPLPAGFDRGDFSARLRALIIALKHCGNMSSWRTSRVQGQFWHTHILCNPFYTLYSTQPRKDRLAVLSMLQNSQELRFRLRPETLDLLQTEFLPVPEKWRLNITALGAVELSAETRNARSSPSAKPKDSTEANTTSPVPSAVISVVIHRAFRFRTVYLTGITRHTSFLKPARTPNPRATLRQQVCQQRLWSGRLLIKLESGQDRLHRRIVRIACPDLHVLFNADGGDDRIGKRHRDAIGSQRG